MFVLDGSGAGISFNWVLSWLILFNISAAWDGDEGLGEGRSNVYFAKIIVDCLPDLGRG